ncbi:hypothetical protein M569_03635, partial [Genlisea aurea]
MEDHDWVTAATTDDSLVVELLVSLHGRRMSSSSTACHAAEAPLEWRVRQRRSKSLFVVNDNCKKKKQRASPTTPLTWCGATSLSGSADGVYDDSAAPPNLSRSKVRLRFTTTSVTISSSSKSSKRKKTVSELRNEENSLVQETKELKREITKLYIRVEKERWMNKKLKRMKKELV